MKMSHICVHSSLAFLGFRPILWVGYLAGAQYSRHAVAVSQGEFNLNIDPPGSLSRDPACPQPVVLARAHHITHLN